MTLTVVSSVVTVSPFYFLVTPGTPGDLAGVVETLVGVDTKTTPYSMYGNKNIDKMKPRRNES